MLCIPILQMKKKVLEKLRISFNIIHLEVGEGLANKYLGIMIIAQARVQEIVNSIKIATGPKFSIREFFVPVFSFTTQYLASSWTL